MPIPNEWTDTDGVAAWLGVPNKTVVQWRYRGTGPRYVKVGKHVRYRWTDLGSWVDTQYAKMDYEVASAPE